MATQSGSSHRNSIAWQKGMALAKSVYAVTAHFPADERFGLTNQLRRAAVSIPSNIAEGRGRLSKREYIQFLSIARGSSLEVDTQLELAEMLAFGDQFMLAETRAITAEVIMILNSTLATLRAQLAADDEAQ